MIAAASALLRAVAPVNRDTAREAAARELSKRTYHPNEPGLVQRIVDKIVSWFGRLGDAATPGTGGSQLGLVALAVVVAAVVGLIVWRSGPLRRSRSRPDIQIDLSGKLDADEHRRRADAYAGERRYAEAVRERMRAIVRELESRGVLDPRPGRTAVEVAREAGGLVPTIAADLRRAARVFDEVWYGGRPASGSTDAAMREADQRIRSARLAVTSAGAGRPEPVMAP